MRFLFRKWRTRAKRRPSAKARRGTRFRGRLLRRATRNEPEIGLLHHECRDSGRRFDFGQQLRTFAENGEGEYSSFAFGIFSGSYNI